MTSNKHQTTARPKAVFMGVIWGTLWIITTIFLVLYLLDFQPAVEAIDRVWALIVAVILSGAATVGGIMENIKIETRR